jgi:glycosyltransferase involved in cell wall biosynthesis
VAEFEGIASRPVIHVVANAVAPVLEPEVIESRYADITGRPVRISFLAAITGPKGAVDFVRAIEAMPAGVRARASFILAGNRDGNFEDDLVALREAVGRLTAEGVDIALGGVVDAATKPGFFASTDVFVLPSHREGQPLVILEALSAGCAVVSTRVGGIPETVVDAESGILVEPRDVPALARVLCGLIEEPATAVALGRQGRHLWERVYRPRVHGAAMAAVFRSVLGPERGEHTGGEPT